MRTLANTVLGMVMGSTVVVGGGGCTPQAPSVDRVPVAAPGTRDARLEYERPKPLPERSGRFDRDLAPGAAFDDRNRASPEAPPLPPEQKK